MLRSANKEITEDGAKARVKRGIKAVCDTLFRLCISADNTYAATQQRRDTTRRDVSAFCDVRGQSPALPLAFNYTPAVINFFLRLHGNTQFQDMFAIIELDPVATRRGTYSYVLERNMCLIIFVAPL